MLIHTDIHTDIHTGTLVGACIIQRACMRIGSSGSPHCAALCALIPPLSTRPPDHQRLPTCLQSEPAAAFALTTAGSSGPETPPG